MAPALPNASVRENVDVVLVALVVALGIRTFFLQPMAIPTGSMQPTLYGITQQNLRADPQAAIPNPSIRVFNARGPRHVVLPGDCAMKTAFSSGFQPAQQVLPLVRKQQLIVGDRAYTVWFPPEEFERRAGLRRGERFRKGEDILKLKVISGDRLFVDRFTYNFHRPRRGDIVIFASHGSAGSDARHALYQAVDLAWVERRSAS